VDQPCACGHTYDEHDKGQECQASVRVPHNPPGAMYQKCRCVYYEATDEPTQAGIADLNSDDMRN
jgi:hypothetical protein